MAFRYRHQKAQAQVPINETQERNCLNCTYNPMTDAEFAAARITGEGIDFICGHNGMFRVKDINHGNRCSHHIKPSLF